jgi:hypothetical protein
VLMLCCTICTHVLHLLIFCTAEHTARCTTTPCQF